MVISFTIGRSFGSRHTWILLLTSISMWVKKSSLSVWWWAWWHPASSAYGTLPQCGVAWWSDNCKALGWQGWHHPIMMWYSPGNLFKPLKWLENFTFRATVDWICFSQMIMVPLYPGKFCVCSWHFDAFYGASVHLVIFQSSPGANLYWTLQHHTSSLEQHGSPKIEGPDIWPWQHISMCVQCWGNFCQ